MLKSLAFTVLLQLFLPLLAPHPSSKAGSFTHFYLTDIVRVHHISKVKVGVKNLLLKTDVERAMAERAAKGL